MSKHKEIKALIVAARALSDQLTKAIFDAAEQVARWEGLDEFLWSHLGNMYTRNGGEVECFDLDELDTIYCDHVHDGGIEVVWVRGEGYV